MGQFIKFVFATIVGLFLFLVIIISIFVGVLSSSSSEKEDKLSDNSVLKLNIDKQIIERESDDIFSKFRGSLTSSDEGGLGLLELRQSIKKAATDSKIKGIFLELNDIHNGFASTEELRNSLIEFKKSGKFIVAYAESYSEISFYLASVADRIFLPSSGDLEFNGINVEMMYFKGTLEKLGIEPEVFKVGQYKSAVEPFTNDKMSDANRTQIKSFIGSLYGYYLANVALARKLNADSLKSISDNMLIRSADDALKYKLVTDVGYFDEAVAAIKEKLHIAKTEKFPLVSYAAYRKDLNLEEKDEEEDKSSKIAVIFASGDIHQGKGDENTIGSESVAEELRKARLDDKVKAIVLRINSPGGSALASDIIWREVVLAKNAKPIIASMSDVAASGGYYIAMGCDAIVADPTTITGSIGVFGLLFNSDKFLKDKLGITTDRQATGKFSGIQTFTRELTQEEKDIIQKEVERIYSDFTSKAAKGRKMSVDSLHAIAQGRVWSALEAKQIGLVDELGGLEYAIKLAAKKASITTYHTDYLPEQKNLFFKEFLSELGEEEGVNSELSKLYPYLKSIKNIQKLEGIQARMPYELSVH